MKYNVTSSFLIWGKACCLENLLFLICLLEPDFQNLETFYSRNVHDYITAHSHRLIPNPTVFGKLPVPCVHVKISASFRKWERISVSSSQFQRTEWKIKPREVKGKLIVLFIHVSHLEEPCSSSALTVLLWIMLLMYQNGLKRDLQEYTTKQNWSIELEFAQVVYKSEWNPVHLPFAF